MQIRKGLLRKRLGIPTAVLLTLILLAITVLAAVVFITLKVKIRYPAHEEVTVEVTVNAGEVRETTVKANAKLPREYKFKWILNGDLNKFSEVEVNIYCDGDYICTISKKAPESEYHLIKEGDHVFSYEFYIHTLAELKKGSEIVEETATLTIEIDIQP